MIRRELYMNDKHEVNNDELEIDLGELFKLVKKT